MDELLQVTALGKVLSKFVAMITQILVEKYGIEAFSFHFIGLGIFLAVLK